MQVTFCSFIYATSYGFPTINISTKFIARIREKDIGNQVHDIMQTFSQCLQCWHTVYQRYFN